MALDVKWTKHPTWSGRTVRDGKRVRIDTGVPVAGTPPPGRKLKGKGDEAFERSRLKAEIEFDRLLAEMDSRPAEQPPPKPEPTTSEDTEILTLDTTDIEKNEIGLFGKYSGMLRDRKISAAGLSQAEALIKRFVAFVRTRKPGATRVSEVSAGIAEGFMTAEWDRKITGKTYNNILVLLRSLFGRLYVRAGMSANPFAGIPKRKDRQERRSPFTLEELELVLTAARKPEHAFIRPAIVVGMCTAMRRGDCCNLRWEDVMLKTGFVEVHASKTGNKVTIPMFPILASEIRARLPKTDSFVFPELAQMYAANPDGITWRVKRVLADAGFSDVDDPESEGHRGRVTKERENGLRAASIRGFHSFRVTWATLALISGVPIELVRKGTGHQSESIWFENYFRPGQEDFKRVLQEKMAKVFALGLPKKAEPVVVPASPTIADRLKLMTIENWSAIRDELVAELKPQVVRKPEDMLLLK